MEYLVNQNYRMRFYFKEILGDQLSLTTFAKEFIAHPLPGD